MQKLCTLLGEVSPVVGFKPVLPGRIAYWFLYLVEYQQPSLNVVEASTVTCPVSLETKGFLPSGGVKALPQKNLCFYFTCLPFIKGAIFIFCSVIVKKSFLLQIGSVPASTLSWFTLVVLSANVLGRCGNWLPSHLVNVVLMSDQYSCWDCGHLAATGFLWMLQCYRENCISVALLRLWYSFLHFVLSHKCELFSNHMLLYYCMNISLFKKVLY